jgi:thiosulfate dehydrogenase [quinone] large subunit
LLFSSTEYAWVWLIARLYLGIQWVESGWHKIFDPAWISNGAAVKAFWVRAVAVPGTGRPPIAYDWYREFLQFMLDRELYGIFGKLVALGEVAVGIALLIGLFTGIAAFFGALVNWNFMLAGTASTNPVLGILGIAVLAAWKTAGWWGADRIVLPLVGAPWQRGPILGGEKAAPLGLRREARRAAALLWLEVLAGGAIIGGSLAYLQGWAQIGGVLLGIAVLAISWIDGRVSSAAGPSA